MFTRRLAIPFLATLLLAGCATDQGEKQTAGAILGGIGGAVAGAQFGKGKGQLASVAAGTLLGAFIGSEVGKSLDRADRLAMDRATERAHAAPVGQAITWNNPDSGHSGTVTPVRDGRSASGEYCREYQSTVNVGGKTESAYGVACRQPDGSWKIVN
ncbi:MAG: glycine zipper 2TM domain-containing protein [Proteobacteria bacterium]|nr:glycine zipper 2TM domain-containing protein [Pseudomonadota bacterium]